MVFRRVVFRVAAFAVVLLVIATSAWADIANVAVTGTVWRVDGNMTQAPSVAPGTNPILTFTAPQINFWTAGNGTLSNFLNFGPGVITSDPDSQYLDEKMSDCTSGSAATSPCYSTVIEVSGTAFFRAGVTYNLRHDDGVVMFAGGNFATPVIYAPGPVVATDSLWTPGSDVSGAFKIFYSGTNGNPEVLQFSGSVPEPSSMLLLGMMGVALVVVFRRKLTA